MFCKYIFGKVGQGLYSNRLFDVAIVNVLMVIIVSIIINYSYPRYRLIYILGSLFIIGMILQRMFCIPTTVYKFLFRHPRSEKKAKD